MSILKKEQKWHTLEGVLNEIWQMLQRGANRFNDPFHWPVLGTADKKGSRSLRTVILRQFILAERMLVCHTDARAPKVREIIDCDNVSWLFYHPRRKVQLRISGKATLHADDQVANEQWRATKISSRLNYCTTMPPGTVIDKPSSGIPEFFFNKVPSLLESETARKNFMAITCRIDSLDWLILKATENRRAQFSWDENRQTAVWLIP